MVMNREQGGYVNRRHNHTCLPLRLLGYVPQQTLQDIKNMGPYMVPWGPSCHVFPLKRLPRAFPDHKKAEAGWRAHRGARNVLDITGVWENCLRPQQYLFVYPSSEMAIADTGWPVYAYLLYEMIIRLNGPPVHSAIVPHQRVQRLLILVNLGEPADVFQEPVVRGVVVDP